MIYEIKISYVIVDKNGNDKTARESLILENAESFANAEEIGYDYGSGLTDIDVTDIKRSKLKEIVNERESEDDLIWLCELQDIFHSDDGEEKELRYKVAVFAKTFDSAKAKMTEYAKQGFDMQIVSIKLSKFKDVLK